MGGEAVEIQAVIPVGAADQRQAVGAEVRAGEPETAAQMLHKRRGVVRVAVEGHSFVQNRPVTGLPQVGVHTRDQPQRIVVEAAADREISFLRKRLILVVGAAVRELGGGNVQNALSCALGNHVDKAQQILAGIPEAHAPPHTAFKITGRPAHVECDHTLILVPDIDHPVDFFVAGDGMIIGKQTVPIGAERSHCIVKLRRRVIPGDHFPGARLVDHPGSGKFFGFRVLDIAKTQHQRLLLAGKQRHMELHRAHRRPAVGDGIGTASGGNGLRHGGGAVGADECVAGGIEAVIGTVCPEDGVVVPPLPVFRFVVNRVRLNLHLADGEIPLEIGAVVHCVP